MFFIPPVFRAIVLLLLGGDTSLFNLFNSVDWFAVITGDTSSLRTAEPPINNVRVGASVDFPTWTKNPSLPTIVSSVTLVTSTSSILYGRTNCAEFPVSDGDVVPVDCNSDIIYCDKLHKLYRYTNSKITKSVYCPPKYYNLSICSVTNALSQSENENTDRIYIKRTTQKNREEKEA
jgi:hypothetical protein